jgi:cellulose biosynthesis protein BcsQ
VPALVASTRQLSINPVAVRLAAGDHVGQRTLLADCDPQANADEMFIPGPEIEFDIEASLPTRSLLRSRFAKTRIDNLDRLPARFDLARGSTSAYGPLQIVRAVDHLYILREPN